MSQKRVAIVGAGPSGLPAIRHALLYGCDPVCFEADDKVGGLWNYKPGSTEDASVMKSTVINSSKEMSAYSDFPPKPETANYMHNKKLLEYFCDYANHYDLNRYVKLSHRVQNITKADNYEDTGRWVVEYTDNIGLSHTDTFDGVVVATGHHKTPNYPEEWPGQSDFKGKILHSHDYKDSAGFEDKVIVALGIGNSGGDIAVELSRVAEQVYLSTRRGSWICSRTYDYGQPIDVSLNTRFKQGVIMRHVPRSIRSSAFQKKLNQRFDHDAYGLQPQHDIFGAHLTTNDDIGNRIVSGTIRVKPNIARFIGKTVHFTDGSSVENVDYVILSTGYAITFPLVEHGNMIKVENNQVDLYKYMFPLDQSHNTLAVLGLIQPLGSIMPISEMQARVFFASLTGEARLPSSIAMKDDMMKKRVDMRKQFYGSPRHTIQVVYMDFMDELATIVGCRPSFFSLLFRDPVLAIKSTFGPCAPYVYRIRGPHAWKGVREAILGLPERVQLGLNPVKKTNKNCKPCMFSKLAKLAMIVAAIALLKYLYR